MIAEREKKQQEEMKKKVALDNQHKRQEIQEKKMRLL